MRPSVCFFENVEGHISLGLPDVIEDLGRLGYRTTWGIFSASEVGAPHQRKRVFIMAHREDERLQLRSSERWTFQNRGEWSEVWNQPIGQGGASGEELAHRKCEGLERWGCGLQPESNRRGTPNNTSESRNLLVNTIDNDGGNVSRNKLGEEEQPISSNSSVLADSLCNGSRESREVRQGANGAIPFSNGESWGAWPSRPRQPQFSWEPPRVVGNAKHNGLPTSEVIGGDHQALHGESPREIQSEQPTRASRSIDDGGLSQGEGASMGNSAGMGLAGRRGQGGMEQESRVSEAEGSQPSFATQQSVNSCAGYDGQTEPSMGGDPNGPTNRVGHAELYVSCDNRTDELRLLGNGVVPATAELAWRTLWRELTA
jgi:hypothetical protein